MDPMTKVSVRDFAIFQLKLLIDGLKDGAVFTVLLVAFVVDLVFRRHGRRRFFYKVMRVSERFDLWLNLHVRRKGRRSMRTAFSDGVRREATQCWVNSNRLFGGSMFRPPRAPTRPCPRCLDSPALPSGSRVQQDAARPGGSSTARLLKKYSGPRTSQNSARF